MDGDRFLVHYLKGLVLHCRSWLGVLMKIHNDKTLLLIIIFIFEEFEYFKLYSCTPGANNGFFFFSFQFL